MIPQETKLLSLLSNNDVTFFIPPYQRNYEWTSEQCEVFFNDITKTCTNNLLGQSDEHFFGSITYFQNETPFGQPNRLVLIDGQQCVTTTMLFLVALRDILEEESLKTFIDAKYLKNENVSGDSEYKIKLKQVETDWIAYKKIILSEAMTDLEKDSAVYRNYQFFKNKINAYQQNNDAGALIDKGINKFSVITIELQPNKNPWENPQEIFESMNSLGKPLSLADLVRNYLLLGLDADKQTELYNKYWLSMEKTIPKKLSDFIRDYMQGLMKCSYPKASETNYKVLYSTFKKIFENANTESVLCDLSEYSKTYSYIVFDKTSGNDTVDLILRDLRKLNVTTANSFLLMLLRRWEKKDFSDADIIEILNVFRIYCIRKRIIGLTNAENKVFPTLVKVIPELVSAQDKKAQMFKVVSRLENRMRLPNDVEMARYLETSNFYNFGACAFVLALIEEKLTKSRPDINDKNLQIEHIMPQKLNDEWKKTLGENAEDIHQENVHTIGNLTLIRHNQELGQKPFDEKKSIYETKAGLQIARTEITNHKKWNKASIKKRSSWIIDFLLEEVIPIPDNMRKTNNFATKDRKGLSFNELQLIGLEINFIEDPTITAKVISDTEVEFEGKKWKLSPLTSELKTRNGTVNKSRSYQGSQFWEYDGIKLADII